MRDHHNSGFGATTVIFYTFFTFVTIACAGTYSGGSGTADDPYKISTVADWQELIATSADYGQHFILLNDIDFDGINLTPVAPDINPTSNGYQGSPFTGHFDGNNNVFSNVVMELPGSDYVGIFGYVGAQGEIACFGAENLILIGRAQIGGLSGVNYGLIDRCSVIGIIRGQEYSHSLGGLCGSNYGTICYSDVQGDITSQSHFDTIGGLCGDNSGPITCCSFSGTVNGGLYIGGLVGRNSSSISDCTSAGTVTGHSCVGGLVGLNSKGMIDHCCSIGKVTGDYDIGGLVGYCSSGNDTSLIRNCYATGSVKGTRGNAGGLVGLNFGTIQACCASGAVEGSQGYVGGLVAGNSGTISESYASGPVTCPDDYVGGLVGYCDGYQSIIHYCCNGHCNRER